MELALQEHRIYILAAVAVVLLTGTGWYIWHRFKSGQHQRHVEAVIHALGLPMIRDVVLPDGLDSLIFIDYLLLVPNGVIVLDIKHSEGHLFGGVSVDQWSQVIKSRTYKFNNPLYVSQTKCQAVAWNVENLYRQLQDDASAQASPNLDKLDWQAFNWQTYGWVVFSNAGNFPKGIPAQVSMIDDLAKNLAPLIDHAESPSPVVRKVWDALHNLSINTRAELPRQNS